MDEREEDRLRNGAVVVVLMESAAANANRCCMPLLCSCQRETTFIKIKYT